MKTILLIFISNRKDTAIKVQQVITAWAYIIKTRLGIHDGVKNNNPDEALLVLELYGKEKDKRELAKKISLIEGVSSQLVELNIPA